MSGRVPLTGWQVDYIGPLLRLRWALFALMAVDMATGLLFAWLNGQANQHYDSRPDSVGGLVQPPVTIQRDQGTYFVGQDI